MTVRSSRSRGRVFRAVIDYTNGDSVAAGFRRRRAAAFRATLLARYPAPRILDVGGTPQWWLANFPEEVLGRLRVTCVNLDPELAPTQSGIAVMRGDACDLQDVGDRAFDIAFSNSVIEHVGGVDRQRAMAGEIRRVARRYWVQTPNRYFPLEPHYLFPAFQFLPRPLKRHVARHWPLQWYERGSAMAMDGVDAIRLLSAREVTALFPDAALLRERAAGLTKSLTAVRV